MGMFDDDPPGAVPAFGRCGHRCSNGITGPRTRGPKNHPHP
jgi:hypothetical protein